MLDNQFEWADLLAYTLGIGLIMSIDGVVGTIRTFKIAPASPFAPVKNPNARI